MTALELLAPARNKEIGIAAIDCGADAVYIAGPAFGARKAAGNSIGDIAELCSYAHRFGVRIFVTVNTVLEDDELETAHRMMLEAQEAGADAFIIRDERICGWKDIRVPLHASTQCSIRTPQRARQLEALGCSRVVLERELSLEEVRAICKAVSCEVEFFVHGAICVCYNGECRMSEYISGRSADKGECIQACRSLYNLEDADGKVLVRNKALLSLKDYNLKNRLGELADAGVCSFKIEGRLKSASYVRNVVREYDIELDRLVASHPDLYCRASAGTVRGGFTPDSMKTFNRGYTELFLDGKRGAWSSMDAPKSMGERMGKVISAKKTGPGQMELTLGLESPRTVLCNGDGFAFSSDKGVMGVRGDICKGSRILCKDTPGLKVGTILYRNIDAAFEKMMETNPCRREIDVDVRISIENGFTLKAEAASADGRRVCLSIDAGQQVATNRERALSMLQSGISKSHEHYSFRLEDIDVRTDGSELPFMSAASINSIRRQLAESIDRFPCHCPHLATGTGGAADSLPVPSFTGTALMHSRYCIRHELGMCLKEGSRIKGPLFLENNGRRFALVFDCKSCEMSVTPVQS